MHRERKNLRIGLVGPGRTRNGLGPFLARHLHAAGAHVVAVAGRTPTSTQAAARALADDLRHPVHACLSVDELVGRRDLDALVIASPIEAHLAALSLAVDAGLPTLCEKPLGSPGDLSAIEAIVARFAARDLLLVENCQWPYVLPTVRALLGASALDGIATFAMHLAPLAEGWNMVAESLSHFLSVLPALRPALHEGRLEDVHFSTRDPVATALTLSFALRGAGPPLACRLELVRHATQPRPAWLAFDGRRVDREIELPRYQWLFRTASSRESAGDPQAALVYSFAQLIQEPEVDRARALAADIRQRARFFCDVWRAYG